MADLDLQDAAVRAIATYLDGVLPAEFTEPVVEGWPEWEEGATETYAPIVSIAPIKYEVAWHTPCPMVVEDDPDDPGNPAKALVTYRVGMVELELQMDLWAPYKAQLSPLARKLSDAMHNDLPWSTGLTLTVADYYDSLLAVYDNKDVTLKAGSQAMMMGDRRRIWRMKAQMDLLVQVKKTRQVTIRLQPRLTIGGVTIAAPDYDVT